jgi:hypothetical protein
MSELNLALAATNYGNFPNVPLIYVGVESNDSTDLAPPLGAKGAVRKRVREGEQDMLETINGRRHYVLPLTHEDMALHLGRQPSFDHPRVVAVTECLYAHEEAEPSTPIDTVYLSGRLPRKFFRFVERTLTEVTNPQFEGGYKKSIKNGLVSLADLLAYEIFVQMQKLRNSNGNRHQGEDFFMKALADSRYSHLLVEPKWERYASIF